MEIHMMIQLLSCTHCSGICRTTRSVDSKTHGKVEMVRLHEATRSARTMHRLWRWHPFHLCASPEKLMRVNFWGKACAHFREMLCLT